MEQEMSWLYGGGYYTALARIAVPIFFMITGYYYINIKKSNRQVYQLKKIAILMLIANVLYAVWQSLIWIISKKNFVDYWRVALSCESLKKFFILNESPFASHLWYLSALLYVLTIVFILDKLKLLKILYYTFPFLLIGDLVLGKYSLLIFGDDFPYLLVRNFAFVGMPYFTIGMLIRRNRERIIKMQKKTLIILVGVFVISNILERYVLIYFKYNAIRDHYISTTFLAVNLFILFLNYYSNTSAGKLGKIAAQIGRNYSSGIYIIHPLLHTVMYKVTGFLGVQYVYAGIAPVVIYFLSLLSVMLWERSLKYMEFAK